MKTRKFNDKIQVLSLDYDQKYAKEILNNLDLEYFPNTLAAVIVAEDKKFEEIEEIILRTSIKSNKRIVIQVFLNTSSTSSFYQKQENGDKLLKLQIGYDAIKLACIKICLKSSKHFSSLESLLEVLISLNGSLLCLNFDKVLSCLNLTPNDKNVILKNAIKNKQTDLVLILLLWFYKLPEELLSSEYQKEDINIICRILEVYGIKILESSSLENIFMTTQEECLSKFLQILLKNEETFTSVVNFQQWRSMRKICLDKNFHSSLQNLQKIEKSYYLNRDIQLRATDIQEFHKNIENGNLKKIKTFVEDFPDFKFCIDERGICALRRSITGMHFEIFTFLLSQNFQPSNAESLYNTISGLNSVDKEKIRVENVRYAKLNPENFINILCTKCILFAWSGESSFAEIREEIIKLCKNPFLKVLLEKVAYSDVQVIFDSKNESMNVADPGCSHFTMGMYYSEEKNVIISRNLNKTEKFASFIHEISHHMFCCVYENGGLPFCKEDIERQKMWENVFTATHETYLNNPEGTHPIVKAAFENYKKEMKGAELAVRVNHLIAFYIDNPDELENVIEAFPEIFAYHERFVLPDFDNTDLRVIKLNDELGVIKKVSELSLKSKQKFLDCKKIFKEETQMVKRMKIQRNEPSSAFTNIKDKKIILQTNFPQMTLQLIIHELFMNLENKLDFKRKNIFVSCKELNREDIKTQIKVLVEERKIDRVLVEVMGNYRDKNLNFLLKLQKVQLVLICDEKVACSVKQRLNLPLYRVTHEWDHLTEKSKKEIWKKKLKFRGNTFRLSSYYKPSESISNEIFTFLCTKDQLEISFATRVEILKFFIPRKIERKKTIKILVELETAENLIKKSGSENLNQDQSNHGKLEEQSKRNVKEEIKLEYDEVSLDDFVTEIQNEKVVLISDIAGSGKTTLLLKVHECFLKNFQEDCVLFIGLKDHLAELMQGVDGTFLAFMIKIMNFNALEAKIFTHKFEKGEIKILFDAFDEISPKCKEETTKLLKLFLNSNGDRRNQIWVTTRTHLEHDLEVDLDALAHRLKILDDEEQIEFLATNWENSHESNEFIRDCAKAIVTKIAEMIKANPSLIGVPLIIKNVAEIFLKEITESFHEKVNKLKISIVYEKIFEVSFNILNERFKENLPENAKKSSSLLKVYQVLAVVHFFGENFANKLGLFYDEDEWPLEEVARGGIIKYDKNRKVQFNHETYPENLLAQIMFSILKTPKRLLKYPTELLMRILNEKKFQVTRMFLDDKLECFEKSQNNVLITSTTLCKTLEENLNCLNFLAEEGFVTFLRLILEFAKKQKIRENFNLYQTLIEAQIGDAGKTVLTEILKKIADEEKFSNFLDEIFTFYDGDVYEKLLSLTNDEDETIFFSNS